MVLAEARDSWTSRAARVAEVIPGNSQPRRDSLGSSSVCRFPSVVTCAPRPGSKCLVKFLVSCPSLIFSLYAAVFLIHLYLRSYLSLNQGFISFFDLTFIHFLAVTLTHES